MSMGAMNWIQRNLGLDVTGESSQLISLSVGGVMYLTSRATLRRFHEHPIFGPLLEGRGKCGEDGSFVIDRDGLTFRHILNFLRSDALFLPEGFDEWEQLLDDVRYFQLPQMEEAILGCFEYQRCVFRRTLPQAVFVHWPPASSTDTKVVIDPSLPALEPAGDAREVRYQDKSLRNIDELVTTLLSAYGYVIQHWNEPEGRLHLSLGQS
uniref:Uncharacterized protein TCIL3000_10_11710 n=1 Tax=Trypanosoma congolense (strain IL3000) TaxID=1068625 RepID=G0UYC3_TRYCI|nr:unnamed protein product [Trypanosoma congolense IL3000]